MTKFAFVLYLFGMLDLVSLGKSEVARNEGWHYYSGKMNNSSVALNIYVNPSNSVTGQLCIRGAKPIQVAVSGKVIKDRFELKTNSSDSRLKKNLVSFTHLNPSKNNVVKDGEIEWNGKLNALELVYEGYDPNSLKNKYQLQKSNVEVEDFFKDLQYHVNGNYKFLTAKQIQFPITVQIKKKEVTIKSAIEFERYFNEIFHPVFKKKLGQGCVCDLRANAQGVMFAEGEIWIAEDDKGKLKVIAINN